LDYVFSSDQLHLHDRFSLLPTALHVRKTGNSELRSVGLAALVYFYSGLSVPLVCFEILTPPGLRLGLMELGALLDAVAMVAFDE
jgi:hypothetical protein